MIERSIGNRETRIRGRRGLPGSRGRAAVPEDNSCPLLRIPFCVNPPKRELTGARMLPFRGPDAAAIAARPNEEEANDQIREDARSASACARTRLWARPEADGR